MRLNFLKLKTNSLLKKNKSLRTSLPYEKAKTTCIIFTVEDKQKHHAVKDFIKKLEIDGKHVQILEYLPDKKDNYEFKFDFFTQKDVSFWGNISAASAIQFSDSPFDYLFCIDLTPNPLILHLLARSKAKCRVGIFSDENRAYLDFMIESVNTYQALLDNIYKYITQLK